MTTTTEFFHAVVTLEPRPSIDEVVYDWTTSDYHSFMEDEDWIFGQYKSIRNEARKFGHSNGLSVRTHMYPVGSRRRFIVRFHNATPGHSAANMEYLRTAA